jgi:mutator protein MutT
MQQATLCYLIKKKNGQIEDICLAWKKRGFGINKFNGAGGKVEDETIEEALAREAKEEIGVEIKNFYKVAELDFRFPHEKNWDQRVHVYLCDKWTGEIKESDEMKPEWFEVKNLPYNLMWPSDSYWLPLVIKGKLVRGKFVFNKENSSFLEQKVEIIKKF